MKRVALATTILAILLVGLTGCHIGSGEVTDTGKITTTKHLVPYTVHRGRALRTLVVGLQPHLIATDEQTGNVFVANWGRVDRYDEPVGNGTISMLNARTGALIATMANGQHASDMAIDTRLGRVFVANWGPVNSAGDEIGNGTIHVFDAKTGATVGSIGVGKRPDGIAIDEQTSHIFIGANGDVDLLDGRAKIPLKTIHFAMVPTGIVVDARARHAFVATADGKVVILDTKAGTVLKTIGVGNTPFQMAVDEQTARVFVAYSDGKTVKVLDAKTGKVLQTIKVTMPGDSPITVDARSNRVFIPQGGSIIVANAKSGKVIRTVRVEAILAAVDQHTNRLFVTSDSYYSHLSTDTHIANGTVTVLDARDGTPLRTVPVGAGSVAIAVDERTGRAFVANQDSNSITMLATYVR